MRNFNKARQRILNSAVFMLLLALLALPACMPSPPTATVTPTSSALPDHPTPSNTPQPTTKPTPLLSSIPPDLSSLASYKVIRQYPHDPQAFTQGLVYDEGIFFESTGLYGQSSLRRVDLETGQVLHQITLDPRYFAEGLVLWDDSLVQLTWKENTGFVYDRDTFELRAIFSYTGEGWGLTHDDTNLIMSDGTHQLRFLDPQTFAEVRRIDVLDNGLPVNRLNELEYIQGEIYANIWQTDIILRIDPADGTILGKIDLTGLLPREELNAPADVLNGIAYDPASNRLFVTGKLWPNLYEIMLVNPTPLP